MKSEVQAQQDKFKEEIKIINVDIYAISISYTVVITNFIISPIKLVF